MKRGHYIMLNGKMVPTDYILDITDKIVDILKKEKITYALAKEILKISEERLENTIIN